MDYVTVKLQGLVELDKATRQLMREFPKQASQALNDTARRTVTLVRREVAAEQGVAQKVIKNRILAFYSTPKNLETAVWIGGKPISASRLPPAVQKKILRKQSASARKPFRQPAITRSKWFRRAARLTGWSKGRPRSSVPNLPIREASVVLVPDSQPALERHSKERMTNHFPKELRRLIERALKRREKRALAKTAKSVAKSL